MNSKRLALSIIVGFVFVYLYEWLVHGVLLMDVYNATANLWRAQEDMQALFPAILGFQFFFVALFMWIAASYIKTGCVKTGLKVGLQFGLLFGVMMAGFYPYMPVPLELGVAWFLSGIPEGLGLGIIYAIVYKQ